MSVAGRPHRTVTFRTRSSRSAPSSGIVGLRRPEKTSNETTSFRGGVWAAVEVAAAMAMAKATRRIRVETSMRGPSQLSANVRESTARAEESDVVWVTLAHGGGHRIEDRVAV